MRSSVLPAQSTRHTPRILALLPGHLFAQARLSPQAFFDAFVQAQRSRDTSRMDTLVRQNKALSATVIEILLRQSLSKKGRPAESFLSVSALRKAREDVRRAGYRHPFFWAPFILIGD